MAKKEKHYTVQSLLEQLPNKEDRKALRLLDKKDNITIVRIRKVDKGCYLADGKYTTTPTLNGFRVKVIYQNGQTYPSNKTRKLRNFPMLLDEITQNKK
jgi:hypothetical protein